MLSKQVDFQEQEQSDHGVDSFKYINILFI